MIKIQHKTMGAILLIAGTAIGAGMLALPINTATNGFALSTFAFLTCWFFMTIAALLLIEVALYFPGEKDLISMVDATLGTWGKTIASTAYLLLLYTLICAYLQGGSAWFIKISEEFHTTFSPLVTILILTLVFSTIIFYGTAAVENINRYLMAGLIITYIILIASALPKVEYTKIATWHTTGFSKSFPLIITAFGFSVILPSLTTYLDRNVSALRTAVMIGSWIPLAIYLLWEFVALGVIPTTGPNSFHSLAQHHDNGTGVTIALDHIVGKGWIVQSSRWFAIFAILTSLLGVSLALSHFLADALAMQKSFKQRLFILVLTYVPAVFIVLLYPNEFSKVLSFAGMIVAVLLGILPALMAWCHRYHLHTASKTHYQVFGGKALLVAVMIFFGYITYLEISNCLLCTSP
jgi:tyrosine-specific transport protein